MSSPTLISSPQMEDDSLPPDLDINTPIKEEPTESSPSGNPYECPTCHKTFVNKSGYSMHVKSHTMAKPYTCAYCPKAFSHPTYLKNHLQSHMDTTFMEKPFECVPCGKAFTTKNGYNTHMRAHNTERPFSCDLCDRSFAAEIYLRNHMKAHSNGEKVDKVCSFCQKEFSDNYKLRRHMMSHTGIKPFVCELCFKSFSDNYKLKRHMNVHMEENQHQCEVCQQSFMRKDLLQQHMYTHTGETPPNVCEICQKIFARKESLVAHMIMHTGEKPYTCEVCNKAFARKEYLSSHMLVHNKVKPYQCPLCSKAFARKSYVTEHMKVHTESSEITITPVINYDPLIQEIDDVDHDNVEDMQEIVEEVEGEMFAEEPEYLEPAADLDLNESWMGHQIVSEDSMDHDQAMEDGQVVNDISNHGNEDSYSVDNNEEAVDFIDVGRFMSQNVIEEVKVGLFKCGTCEEIFDCALDLKLHMKEHPDSKIYECSECERQFNESYKLERHMKIHTEDKPFTCPICKSSFANDEKLNKHLTGHSDDNPYKCDKCSKVFFDNYKLKRHMNVHSTDRHYKCDMCEKTFARKDNLKTHRKLQHASLLQNDNTEPKLDSKNAQSDQSDQKVVASNERSGDDATVTIVDPLQFVDADIIETGFTAIKEERVFDSEDAGVQGEVEDGGEDEDGHYFVDSATLLEQDMSHQDSDSHPDHLHADDGHTVLVQEEEEYDTLHPGYHEEAGHESDGQPDHFHEQVGTEYDHHGAHEANEVPNTAPEVHVIDIEEHQIKQERDLDW